MTSFAKECSYARGLLIGCCTAHRTLQRTGLPPGRALRGAGVVRQGHVVGQAGASHDGHAVYAACCTAGAARDASAARNRHGVRMRPDHVQHSQAA